MVVKFLHKTKGYSFRMLNPKHSPMFWSFCKSIFPEEVLWSLKCYQRAPMNLELLYKSLQKYDVVPPPKCEDEHTLAAESWVRSNFIPDAKIPLTKIEHLSMFDLPTGTNPGYPYVQQGFKTKGDAWSTAYQDAVVVLEHYLSGKNNFHFPPCMAFCRSKVVKRLKPKIRFIFGVSLQVLILQMIFYKNIWSFMQEGRTPAAYQNTLYHDGYGKLLDEMDSKGVSIEQGATVFTTDFENYDTKCGYWLTKKSYDVLENMLDFSTFSDGSKNENVSGYKRLFNDLIRNDVDTEILMPDGYLWKKNNGDSTGSRSFQLMQNVRTCLINQSVHHKMFGRLAPFMKSLGDDCIWSDYVQEDLDYERASLYVAKTFGPSYNTSKCKTAKLVNQMTFLGRNFWGRGTTRDIFDVVCALLYPEQEGDDYVMLYQRIIAMYYEMAGGDTKILNFLEWCCEIIPKDLRVSLSLGEIPPRWTNYQLKIFDRLGLEQPPTLKIPDPMYMYVLCNYDKYVLKNPYVIDVLMR